MSPARPPGATSHPVPASRRDVLRALVAPTNERSDELLACCLRVAEELGLPEPERIVLGRAAQLHDLAQVPRTDELLPELRSAATVARRALERWDATRRQDVPLASQVLAACHAWVSGERVWELCGQSPGRFAPEVVEALAGVAADRPHRAL